MEDDFDVAKTLIGFLSVSSTNDNEGFIGSILITDGRGYPLEFRCTTPVKPSLIQQTLYGSALEPHILLELCGEPLIGSAQRRPKLLVVNTTSQMELQTSVDFPVVAVQRADETLTLESPHDMPNLVNDRLESSETSRRPIVWWYTTDQNQKNEDLNRLLNNLFLRMDLMEPFERSKAALGILAQQDSKYA